MNARFKHPSAKSHGATAPPVPGATVSSAVLAGRGCCCAARAAVQVTMPATATRPHETDLLLCGHHYRISRRALEAASAAVRELPGTPDDVAAWIDVHRPAALAGR
ncbi:MAG TPA: hypothetical protein VFV73_29205 [Streptosporangiaceae bacterium]|nr:hypothetical protein [Streptosporangiaceae bacterium]